MGNVRNPVGPLPSSIYWRRRAVVACLLALLVALVAWMLTSGGGGGSGGGSHRSGAQGPGKGHTPLPSITPGPTASQTGITTVPGGRSGGSSDGGDGGPTATDSGAADSGGTAGTSGADGAGGTSGGAPRQLPAGTSVPDCATGTTRLALHSAKNSYRPGEKPKLQVSAVNSGGGACKVDFSAVSAVVTIVDSSDHHVWASDDCPAHRSARLFQVPADGTATYDVPWNRTLTAPRCATPTGAHSAKDGTYLAKVALPGLGSAQASFVLSNV